MIARLYLFAFLFATALAFSFAPLAQNQSDGTLHVVRPSIDAEQDMAELCVEFDHALDRTNPGKILAGIHLESEGKAVPLSLPDVNLGPMSFCIQGLAHRRDFSLSVSDLRGAAGEKLTEAYKLSFTVPDRQPALAFAGVSEAGHLARIRDNDPVLRAINVTRAKVSLYRIEDPSQMATAFRQRALTNLAPSESLYFAKTNGKLVWQDELMLTDDENKSANRNLEHPVPLRAAVGTLTSGLYLIVAQDTAPPSLKVKTTTPLAPIAAQWFTHADLKIRVLPRQDGFSVVTEKADEPTIAKDVRLILFGVDDKSLAEAKSDINGLGFLPLAADKIAGAVTVIGLTSGGDADFVDLAAFDSSAPQSEPTLPNLSASMATDRLFYAPGAEGYLTLTARNEHGEAQTFAGSSVQLLRPDRRPYAILPMPEGKAGVFYLPFSAPAVNGTWHALWQQNGGQTLAEVPLRVTSNPDAPQISLAADRAAIDNDGNVNLSLKSSTINGAPAAYAAGRVFVQWTTPDKFMGWADYHFGREDNSDRSPSQIAAFITDANGTARARLNLKPPDDGAPLHTALISIRSDPASNAFDPDSVELPVRPDNYIIGVKPLTPDAKFAENGLANFDVIALDGDGKRHDNPGLKYQIYQEGRSFAWYQAEGRWDYKQLQQRRRSGGGALDIKADGTNVIRWPVTTGVYVLEITDANGVVLTRLHFSAGWGFPKTDQIRPASLALTADTNNVLPGAAAHIRFKLDSAAVISAVVADDQIRKIIHETRPAGVNQLAIMPEESWGNRIRISIHTEQKTRDGMISSFGQIDLSVHHHEKELVLVTDAPLHLASGQQLSLAATVSAIEKRQPTFVSLLATPLPEERSKVSPPASMLMRDITVGSDGKATIRLPLPSFSGILRLVLIASNSIQEGRKELSIPIATPFAADMPMPEYLATGDLLRLTLVLRNNNALAGPYRYSLNDGNGLKLSGAIEGHSNFSPGTRKVIAADLTAAETGTHTVRVDVGGPHDFHFNRSWAVEVLENGETLIGVTEAQIAPKQTWTSAQTEKSVKAPAKSKTEVAITFIAPQPLFNAPQMLPAFMASAPMTTSEIAAWLAAARLWQEPIVKLGLLSENALKIREQDYLKRLLARQKPDGSFPPLPGGDSDLVGTGDALVALTLAEQPWSRPAADAATNWLQQRLSNTWFGQDERPARAAAFAALAAADRLDVAALRYFAETSAGKDMPPLAAAYLGFALAKSNDQDKAAAWLKAARGELAKKPELWPLLAENTLFDPHDLTSVLDKVSQDLTRQPMQDPHALVAFLRASGILINRAGTWHVTVNGADKNQVGIMVITPAAKSGAVVLQNPMDQPLYVKAGEKPKASAQNASAAITRRIYRMGGMETPANDLKQGEVYLVMLEGNGPEEDDNNDTPEFFIHDNTTAELRPLSCLLDAGAGAQDAWAWLKNFSLTPVSVCETDSSGIDAVLTPAAGAKLPWRVAYLAKADYAGTFNLAPATVRGAEGPGTIGNAQSITIK